MTATGTLSGTLSDTDTDTDTVAGGRGGPSRRNVPTGSLTPRATGPALVDTGVMVALLVVALAGLLPAFSAGPLALAAGIGLALGAALALLGARRRLPVLTLSAAAIAGYVLTAGAVVAPSTTIAGVLPTLATLRELALATVRSWRDMLTLSPPFDGRPALLAVPVLLALIGSLLAVSFALRLRRPWWALVPVAAVLVAAGLLGTREPWLLLPRAALLTALILGWAAWRWRERLAAAAVSTESGTLHARPLSAAGTLAVAVAGAVALGPLTATEAPRFILRDHVVPPFQLTDYASPLQSFRGYVRDHSEDVLFTASGLPSGARLRLATMDGYDGIVYDVTQGAYGGSFVLAPATLPLPMRPAEGEEVSVEVTVGAYSGVWVPTVGEPRELVFTGSHAQDQQRNLHYDAERRSAVTTATLTTGDAFTLEAVLPSDYADDQLAGAAPAQLTLPAVDSVPASVGAAATELLGDDIDAAAIARQLQAELSTRGFFSNGLDGQAPSRSGHGAARIHELLLDVDQMVGDAEQYAVAMALMARHLGLPSRVVMGFVPEATASGTVELTGADMTVWTEIAFEGYGWVAYDPTPDEDQTPRDSTSDPRSNPRPQVLQPPPPPEEPVREPPLSAPEEQIVEDEESETAELAWWVMAGIAVGVSLLLLVTVPIVLVLLAKRLRRRRRASAPLAVDRIAGGWHEVLDTATDLGLEVPAHATRRRTASLLESAYGVTSARTLAAHADAYVFGGGDPTPDHASAVWAQVRDVVTAMRRGVPRRRRVSARLSLRSLRGRGSGRRRSTSQDHSTSEGHSSSHGRREDTP